LLAVTVMGITLANYRALDVEHILDFKENLSTLLISMLFLLLSARIEWPSPSTFAAGLVILAVAMLVVRPAAVLLSTLGSPLAWRERAMVAYISPRGIVAAAVSALFALRLDEQGIAGAELLVHLTFMMIIGTVLVQSATASRVARALGVAAPEPRGVLIVGSTPFSRLLGAALEKQDIRVVIADDDWSDIREARMAGLQTYFGNPVTEHAAQNLPLTETAWMLAMSARVETNSLACMRYRPEFGKQNVLQLRLFGTGEAPRAAHAEALQARTLFGREVTQGHVQQLLGEGWGVRVTRLSESFGWKQLCEKFDQPPLALFSIDERGQLRFAVDGGVFEPRAGWRVGVLARPEAAPRSEAHLGPGEAVRQTEDENRTTTD